MGSRPLRQDAKAEGRRSRRVVRSVPVESGERTSCSLERNEAPGEEINRLKLNVNGADNGPEHFARGRTAPDGGEAVRRVIVTESDVPMRRVCRVLKLFRGHPRALAAFRDLALARRIPGETHPPVGRCGLSTVVGVVAFVEEIRVSRKESPESRQDSHSAIWGLASPRL